MKFSALILFITPDKQSCLFRVTCYQVISFFPLFALINPSSRLNDIITQTDSDWLIILQMLQTNILILERILGLKFWTVSILLILICFNQIESNTMNLRIDFLNIYLLRNFCPHLGSFFVLFLLSLRFGQISPLAFFRWFTATSDRNAESCNRIPSNYCLP